MRVSTTLRRYVGLAVVVLPLLAGAASIPAPAWAAARHVTAGDANQRDRAPSGTLTVVTLQGVDSLNPFLGEFASASQIFSLAYDYLTDYNPADNRPVPGLARSWSTSRDGLRWTFTIRTGVRWSDGRPLTAADVAFTYNLMLRNPAARTANGGLVKDFAWVGAPNATTVVIATRVPTATMLGLDIPIVPRHVWAHVRSIDSFGNDHMPLVGSGPFRLVEARADQYYRFTANRGYWRGAPGVRELVLRQFDDSEAAVQALRRGEVDVVSGLTPAQFQALGRDRDLARNQASPSRLVELAFNPGAATADGSPIGDGNPVLRDVRVRTAIDYAIDRNALQQRALGGYGVAGAGYLPPATGGWSWRPNTAARRSFDPRAANRLLDMAGYRRGADGVRLLPGSSRRLVLRLYVPAAPGHYQQSARYLVAWLRRIGLEVHERVMTATELDQVTAAGRYDMFLGGWGTDPDPDYVLSVQTCAHRPGRGGGDTDAFHCDPVYDRLYGEQARELTRERRIALVQRMQQRMYETAAQSILYYPDTLEAYRKNRFTGFVHRPAFGGRIAGPWSYMVVKPVAARSPNTGRPPLAPATETGLVGAVAAIIWLGRRRATRDHRE